MVKPWISDIGAQKKGDDEKVVLVQLSTIIILIRNLCEYCGDINSKEWETYRDPLEHTDQRIDDNWFMVQARTVDTLEMLVC